VAARYQRAQRQPDVSRRNDPLEMEADRIADRAMGAGAVGKGIDPGIAAAGGQGLPEGLRRYFEPRLGLDLSGVRIHNDSGAHAEAESVDARAFTQGHHISFGEDQFNPRTDGGLHLIAHELAHVAQASRGEQRPGRMYRETWDVDDANRTVERGLLVQLIFENTWEDMWNGTGWTEARKNTFRSDFESSIENTFNSGGFVLRPPADTIDVLPAANIAQGYVPSVDIRLVPDGDLSVAEDWEVDVSSNPTSTFRTSSSNTSYGTLDEADNAAVTKTGAAPGVTQIPTVHEFGHFIGLDHPGEGLEGGLFSDSRLSPGANEYSHTGTDANGRTVDGPNDLMGAGMGMRAFYYDAWAEALDGHIEELRDAAEDARDAEEWRRFLRDMGLGDPDIGDFPLPAPGDTQTA
jgi:hypothetical protein